MSPRVDNNAICDFAVVSSPKPSLFTNGQAILRIAKHMTHKLLDRNRAVFVHYRWHETKTSSRTSKTQTQINDCTRTFLCHEEETLQFTTSTCHPLNDSKCEKITIFYAKTTQNYALKTFVFASCLHLLTSRILCPWQVAWNGKGKRGCFGIYFCFQPYSMLSLLRSCFVLLSRVPYPHYHGFIYWSKTSKTLSSVSLIG